MGTKEEKLKLIVLKSALEYGKKVDEELKNLYQTDRLLHPSHHLQQSKVHWTQ